MSSHVSSTLAERRQRLALACELDRLHLRLALRPVRRRDLKIGGLPVSTLTKAFSFAQFLPGKFGRIARGAALGADILKTFNPLARFF